jgi:phospholipase/carboxylesterase
MNTVQYTQGPLQTDSVSGLSYRVRQPAPAKPGKLLVLLHGVGSHEANLLELADGVATDTLVALVRGPLAMGPQQFAWFPVAFTPSGPQIDAEAAERSRIALTALLHQLQQQYGIAPEHSVMAGFSQGGILSASVALASPEALRGFAVLSGRILPELEPHIASRERLSHLRAFVGHGTLDSRLPVFWAERSDALLNRLGITPVSRRYPIDHFVSEAMHADFVQWLTQ